MDGIYNRTQMAEAYRQWQDVLQNRWKIGALQDIITRAGLVGKNSTPYTPSGRHDFMHNKVLVIARSVGEGAAGIVWLAAAAPQDFTGKFVRDRKVIPW